MPVCIEAGIAGFTEFHGTHFSAHFEAAFDGVNCVAVGVFERFPGGDAAGDCGDLSGEKAVLVLEVVDLEFLIGFHELNCSNAVEGRQIGEIRECIALPPASFHEFNTLMKIVLWAPYGRFPDQRSEKFFIGVGVEREVDSGAGEAGEEEGIGEFDGVKTFRGGGE